MSVTSETVIALPARLQDMTDDPEGSPADPGIPEHDNTTQNPPEKMGPAFWGALALVGMLVLLIVFINIPGIRASAGVLLTQHTWTLESYGDKGNVLVPSINGTPVTARFDTEGRVYGSAGCNLYSANYTTGNLAITISSPVMTEKYCENTLVMQQESAYLTDLSKVTELRVSTSELNLYDKTGKPVLVYRTNS